MHIVQLHWDEMARKDSAIEVENRTVLCIRAWERGLSLNCHEGPFGRDEIVLKLDCSDSHTMVYIY